MFPLILIGFAIFALSQKGGASGGSGGGFKVKIPSKVNIPAESLLVTPEQYLALVLAPPKDKKALVIAGLQSKADTYLSTLHTFATMRPDVRVAAVDAHEVSAAIGKPIDEALPVTAVIVGNESEGVEGVRLTVTELDDLVNQMIAGSA